MCAVSAWSKYWNIFPEAEPAETTMAEPTPDQRPRGWLVLKHHLLTHKIDIALWATRLATIIFTIGYILPIMGNPYNSYYKVRVPSHYNPFHLYPPPGSYG